MNSSFHNHKPFEANLDTNVIPATTPECNILPDGKVRCPNVIYHDRKSWRRSRHQVENEIQQLKEKLEKLKEIRRHLKHAKPAVEDDLIGSVLNATETADFNQVRVNLVPNYNIFPIPIDVKDNVTTEATEKTHIKRKKTHHRTSLSSNFDNLKPENDSNTNNNDNITFFESNFTDVFSAEISTKMPIAHHRHHHHHKHRTTTKNDADLEITTERFYSGRSSVSGDELESKITTQRVSFF